MIHRLSLFHRLRRLPALVFATLVLLATGCSTLDRGVPPTLERQASWTVLPFANHTETPLAASRAEAIAESLLNSHGVGQVRRQAGATTTEALFDGGGEREQRQAALAWAKQQGIRYALTGSVEEWRYKVGVDGEPAVGLTLQIVEVASGDTLWSGAGGKSGWSREALAAVAQQLIRDLLRAGLAGQR